MAMEAHVPDAAMMHLEEEEEEERTFNEIDLLQNHGVSMADSAYTNLHTLV